MDCGARYVVVAGREAVLPDDTRTVEPLERTAPEPACVARDVVERPVDETREVDPVARAVVPVTREAGRETAVAAVRRAAVFAAEPAARTVPVVRDVPEAGSREPRATEEAPPVTRPREEWVVPVTWLRPAKEAGSW